MKKINVILFLFSAFLMFSCSSDDDGDEASPSREITNRISFKGANYKIGHVALLDRGLYRNTEIRRWDLCIMSDDVEYRPGTDFPDNYLTNNSTIMHLRLANPSANEDRLYIGKFDNEHGGFPKYSQDLPSNDKMVLEVFSSFSEDASGFLHTNNPYYKDRANLYRVEFDQSSLEVVRADNTSSDDNYYQLFIDVLTDEGEEIEISYEGSINFVDMK